MATFVLVHGSWHGAWCWDRLVPELESRGHQAITMDLPIDDPSAGLAEYAEAVVPLIPDESAILVGHSLGASVIPLVAAQRAVQRMVFLCPVIRRLGMSIAEGAPLDADVSTYDLSKGRTFYDDSSSAWTDVAGRSPPSSPTATLRPLTGPRAGSGASTGATGRSRTRSPAGPAANVRRSCAPMTTWSASAGLGDASRNCLGRRRSSYPAATRRSSAGQRTSRMPSSRTYEVVYLGSPPSGGTSVISPTVTSTVGSWVISPTVTSTVGSVTSVMSPTVTSTVGSFPGVGGT